MSTHRVIKTSLWTGLRLLAVFVFALGLAAQSAQAAGAQKHNANPQKLTADKADAMVVQLANEVFGKAIQPHNSALDRKEFRHAKELLRTEMLRWASTGNLAKLRKSGWKPATVAGATSSTSGTALVDISKIEKALKVSLPDFTVYTRYVVDQAEQQLPTVKRNAAHPARTLRKQVVVRKPVVSRTIIKEVPVKNPKATTGQ